PADRADCARERLHVRGGKLQIEKCKLKIAKWRQPAARPLSNLQFSFFNFHFSIPTPMNRPWQIWIGFAAALTVVAAGVGWLSFRALESDSAEAAARRQAALEEDVRVALWRMDSLMSTFVAQESARGADAWQPFGFNTQSDNSRNRGRRPIV